MVGYARVSTRDQDPASQERELTAAGAVRVFVDHGESSRFRDRPQWLACLDYLRPGDMTVGRPPKRPFARACSRPRRVLSRGVVRAGLLPSWVFIP